MDLPEPTDPLRSRAIFEVRDFSRLRSPLPKPTMINILPGPAAPPLLNPAASWDSAGSRRSPMPKLVMERLRLTGLPLPPGIAMPPPPPVPLSAADSPGSVAARLVSSALSSRSRLSAEPRISTGISIGISNGISNGISIEPRLSSEPSFSLAPALPAGPLPPEEQPVLGWSAQLKSITQSPQEKSTAQRLDERLHRPPLQPANQTRLLQRATPMASLASEGEAPAGEAPHGEAPAGEATHGEAAPGEATHGEATPGEATHGEATPGEGPPSEASAPPLAATSLPRVGGGAKEGGGQMRGRQPSSPSGTSK